MSNTRYQIFVSSTFSDLKEERDLVMDSILRFGHIPAGMEQFPASDEEQFEFIKRIIDESDYYVLIIAGRYGSISPEGISYTEKEFNYALERGLPVLAFIHENIEALPQNKIELDAEKRTKLTAFRETAKSNRLVKFWNTKEELPDKVILSLIHTMQIKPQPGWIRGGGVDNTELLQQLNSVRLEKDNLIKTNVELKQKLSLYEKAEQAGGIGDEEIKIEGNKKMKSNDYGRSWSVTLTMDRLFSLIGPHLFSPVSTAIFKKKLEKVLQEYLGDTGFNYFSIGDIQYQEIKMRLFAKKLIKVYSAQSMQGGIYEFIELTKLGTDYLTYSISNQKLNA